MTLLLPPSTTYRSPLRHHPPFLLPPPRRSSPPLQRALACISETPLGSAFSLPSCRPGDLDPPPLSRAFSFLRLICTFLCSTLGESSSTGAPSTRRGRRRRLHCAGNAGDAPPPPFSLLLHPQLRNFPSQPPTSLGTWSLSLPIHVTTWRTPPSENTHEGASTVADRR